MPEINKSDARCKASRYRPITIPSGYSDEAYGQDRIVSRGNVFYKLSELTYAIAKADRKCGKPVRKGRCIFSPATKALEVELKEAIRVRDAEADLLQRRLHSRQICKMKRSLTKKKAEEKCTAAINKLRVPYHIQKKPTSRVYGLVDAETGSVYNTPAAVESKATSFYSNLFNGESDDDLPTWIWKRWSRSDLTAHEEINGRMVKELIFELGSCKTCADDHIVAEMLFQLGDDVIEELARAFIFRIINHETEDTDNVWATQSLNLIKKSAHAITIEEFRPIAIIAVLQKLYSKVLLRLTKGKCEQLDAPQFAFRKDHQTHEVIFILRQLVEKAIEWNLPLFIMDGDIKKAYDYTRHSHMIDGLSKKGIEDIIIAAIIREIRKSQTVVVVDATTKTEAIPRARSAPQGGPGMPSYFNATLDVPAGCFVKMAQCKKWGWKMMDGSYLAIILYADNYWLIACSHGQLQDMMEAWHRLLRQYGWDTPAKELVWATTLMDTEFTGKIYIDGLEVKRASRDMGIKALGTIITFNGRNDVELKNRITRAERAFAKYHAILCNKAAPMTKRLAMLTILINGSLFWCSGSWNLTNAQLSNLKDVQLKMMRKMLGARRGETETLDEYMVRTNATIRDLRLQCGVQTPDIMAMRHHFVWAGHVSRLSQESPSRITGQILRFRDRRWLNIVEAENNGNQLHGRRFRVWRWESPMVKYAKHKRLQSWHDLAADKRTWMADVVQMAQFLRDNRA